MTYRNAKITGLLATTATALALTPAVASADFSVTGAAAYEGDSLAFVIDADCENGIWPCVDERFSYSVDGGSARVGEDLPAASSTVLLSATPFGHNKRIIEIPTTNDSVDEPDLESVTLRVTHSGKFGAATRVATGNILDNDVEPAVDSVSAPANVSEGTGGETTVPFTFRLQKASEQAVVRGYSTYDGSAKAGTDYQYTAGTMTFQPGETEKTVNVPIVTDSVEEPSETFSMSSGPASATVRILDDDVTPKPGNPNPGKPDTGTQNPVDTGGAKQPAAQAPVVSYVPSNVTKPAAKKAKAKVKKCRKGFAKKGKGKKVRCVKKAAKRGSKNRK